MEDEKLADKLLDRILMVLMPYDQIDVERVKAKLTVVLDDYQISPKQEALAVYTEGKNDYYLRKFLLAKAVAGRQERTLRQYKDEVGRALRGIGKDADTITADDIQVYLAKVLSRGGSKCYCDNIRRDLSSFYNWLYREEIIRTNPMNKIDNIKFKREKEKALTDMEIEVMRQACQTTMQKAIMEMLLSTGCRASELVSIKIADMDEDKVSVLGKGGKWRTVYINAKAFVAVKNYLADRKDTNPYLFPREINTKERTMISNFSRKDWFKDPRLVTKADHFGGDSVNNMVRTIGKRAGVKGVHTHRFRRTCATQALRHGMPIELVSMMLGHEQISTTQIFSSRTRISLMSQSSALHIWSSCSRLTRSVISWYRSLIVEALIPVSRTRSACVHFLSPRRVDSKILIIEPISFTSYSIKSSRVCKEYGRIWRENGIF